jgi:DNA-binding response OmpR family regulator
MGDDDLPKPFGTDILLARIRAVLRRSGRVIEETSPYIRTDCRAARVGPTTPTGVWDTGMNAAQRSVR